MPWFGSGKNNKLKSKLLLNHVIAYKDQWSFVVVETFDFGFGFDSVCTHTNHCRVTLQFIRIKRGLAGKKPNPKKQQMFFFLKMNYGYIGSAYSIGKTKWWQNIQIYISGHFGIYLVCWINIRQDTVFYIQPDISPDRVIGPCLSAGYIEFNFSAM